MTCSSSPLTAGSDAGSSRVSGVDADLDIGLYYPKAGTRHASGIAVYVEKLALALAERYNCSLFVADESDRQLKQSLLKSAVECVQIPCPKQNRIAAGIDRFTPFGELDIPSLFTFAGGIFNGVLEQIETTVDVLVTHYYLDNLLLSRLVDVPVIYLYHGVPAVGLGSKTQELLSTNSVTVANSYHTAEKVAEFFDHGVDGIVPPGVDIDLFTPKAPSRFSTEELSVLFVGRTVEEKGIYDLIDAFSRISDRAHLHIVGGRGDRHALNARIATNDLSDSVTFHGTVPHAKLPEYYSSCDLFCSPSYYESFGMTNLEAMACGKPVITTDTGGVTEYATDRENALLINPGDVSALSTRLEWLSESSDERTRLGQNARRTATEFSWRAQADRMAWYCDFARDENGSQV